MTTLLKLEKQWRITHDFKPTVYNIEDRETLCLMKGTETVMYICFTETTTLIRLISQYWLNAECLIKEVPKIGEWTTIDVINEELKPGKCTLTVFFGGRQVFKEEKLGTRAITDVETSISSTFQAIPGFIRELTIMTKK